MEASGNDQNNAESGGEIIGTAATSLEEQILQQSKLEEALREEVMALHQYCEKRVEEVAELRRKKWELEEKLQLSNIQNDLMNEELEIENKLVEAEVMELAKLDQTIWEEKNKQIKNVEEYEGKINSLFQQLDSLPSFYDNEKVCNDIQNLKKNTEMNLGKLKTLAEQMKLYKAKCEALESGEEIRFIHTVQAIRTEMEAEHQELALVTEQNEKVLKRLENEVMQLNESVAKLQKLSS